MATLPLRISDRLPATFMERLRVPLIAAPMFRISGPDLVVAAARSGIVGSFPAANARTSQQLDDWLADIRSRLEVSGAPHGPVCVNLVIRSPRLAEDLEAVVAHGVEMVVTSVGSPREVVRPLHDAGTIVFCDVATVAHARKAIESGIDGLVLLTAGAGGQSGWLNPFAFTRAVREFYDGPVVIGGGISDGTALASARVLGADLGYTGTRFIAAEESMATDEYRAMLADATIDDVQLTRAFSGLPANMLRPSIVAAGLDPDGLDESVTPEQANTIYGSHGLSRPKRYSSIFAAGHTVSHVRASTPAAAIVDEFQAEYEQAFGG